MKSILPILCIFTCINCFGQWSTDPSQNNYIAIGGAARRHDPVVTTDGRGGAIVAYVATENGTTNIYVERIDADGNLLWGDLGAGEAVAVGDASMQFITPHIVSDGHGGAIVAFHKYVPALQTVTVALQRYDSTGAAKWPAGGVYVNPAGKQEVSCLVDDDNGGAVITWLHSSVDDGSGIAGQHINAAGTLTWPGTEGTVIRQKDVSGAGNLHVVKDGKGGIFAGWNDGRSNAQAQGTGIYLQHVTANGANAYTAGGIAMYNPDAKPGQTDSSFWLTDMAPSGNGAVGIVMLKQDFFTGQGIGYFTYFTNAGTLTFSPAPLTHLPIGYSTIDMKIANTGKGRFITVYETSLNGSSNFLYTQGFDSTKKIYWQDTPICKNLQANASAMQMIDKGDGAAIVTWVDRRSGYNIYAQGINNYGHILADVDGVPVTSNYAMQQFSTSRVSGQIALTGDHTAAIVWEDSRVPNVAIYGSLLSSVATLLPVNLLSFTAAPVKNTNVLNWVTANEINNAGFNVQRSSSGLGFTNIGYVAANNSNAANIYNFTDAAPLNGNNYYRLAQLDKDGKTHYSKIVVLKQQAGMQVSVSPNPAANQLRVTNAVAGSNIKIIDAAGRVLKISVATSTQAVIDISSLAAGVYYCNIGKTTLQFIKQGR